MEKDNHTDEEIKKILSLKNIAVIGISKNEEKAANSVPKYLHTNGYNIIPINPKHDEVFDIKCHPNISEVEQPIDLVDIFRPSDDVLPFVKDAIKVKPKVIWLQLGIHNHEAEDLAKKEGIDVVFNRCILVEHERLMENA